jgi:hypothetical protein
MSLGPATPLAEWAERFGGWQRSHGRRLVRTQLAEHVPASLAEEVCRLAGIGDVRAAESTATQRRVLAEHLCGLLFRITGTEGFGQAIITRGGVSLKEVEPATLESRRASGLFFAGELLDLDGPCGGYNLQWAFASGALAGRSAADALAPSNRPGA